MTKPLKSDVPLHSQLGNISTLEIARLGEEAAADYFAKEQYIVMERNWHSGRFGEIDLILRRPDGLLIFAEIKTRRVWRNPAGFVDYGFDAINWSKRRKILISARSYVARLGRSDIGYQCDAVLVTYEDVVRRGETLCLVGQEILHIPGAFDSV